MLVLFLLFMILSVWDRVVGGEVGNEIGLFCCELGLFELRLLGFWG